MKRFKKRPSPAMIVAIAALSVSLVGTAVAGPIAEISLNRGEKKQVRKISRNIAGKVSNRRVTKRAPGLNVASARNAVIANVANASNFAHTATNAQNAENADSADHADDADSLGGVLASGYVRNVCGSLTGQIRGFARVPASGSFPSTFTDVSEAYNCSGGAVQAKRIGAGSYEVRFLNSPVTIATGNIVNNSGFIDSAFVSFTRIGPGHLRVHIYNAVLESTQDRPFSVLTP